MPDDQAEVNCAIGVCCGDEKDGGVKQRRAVAAMIGRRVGHKPLTLAHVADAVCDLFDLAEKDTLKPFVESIAKLARGNDYE